MNWLILALVISCSSIKNDYQKQVELRWKILEEGVRNKWSQTQLTEVLGEPSHQFIKKEIGLAFESKENGYQQWWASFDKKSKVLTSIGYKPLDPLRKYFTIEKILDRWKKFNCKVYKSKEYKRVGHVYYKEEYYQCDNKIRIDYNPYNEVEWISVGR